MVTFLRFIILLLLFSSSLAIGQAPGTTQTVFTGRVTDQSNGSPMPGVSVKLKGKPTATITDADGNFSIRAEKSATLVFSSVGFSPQEIKLTGETLSVSLQATSAAVR